jgi:WD40 repeat protein
MLRENTDRRAFPQGTPSRLAASSLMVLAYTIVVGLSNLYSADQEQPAKSDEKKPAEVKPRTDLHGDALPAGALQRLGTVRFRHNATAIAYSPDGKILASGGHDNAIRLFDAASGKEIRRLLGHKPRSYSPTPDPANSFNPVDALVSATGEGGVNSVAFSPDGKVLASGGWDDTVRLWDVATGKELRKIDAHKAMVGRVVFSPDGKILASRGGLDGTVRLWDPTTGTQLQKFVGLSNVNPWRFNHDLALAISPDAKTVAATARNVLVFFDIASGTELKRLPAHVYGITVAYSPDGKLLASGGVDEGKDVYSLRIWDVGTGKELRKCELPKNEPPTYISWDPNNNGKFAAVVAEDVMHIFDATMGKEVIPLKHYWPSRVIYSPDGKTLASAGSGPTIRHWDAATGKELHLEFEGHLSGVSAVAVTADGKLVASGGESIRLWDPANGKMVRKIEVKGGVSCLAFAPDGKTLACGGLGRIVHIWDIETGKSLNELKPHTNQVCGLAFSRDGKLLASGDAQSTIRIWDVKEAKVVQEIDNKSGTDHLSMEFAPDDKTLVCAGAWNDSSFLPKKGDTLKINGKEVKFDGVISIQGVEMSRKEGYYVMQWDVSTGKEVRKFGGLKDTIRSLAFSDDGKLVAGASKDGKICLWDAETGEERLYIVAHPSHVDAAFSGSPCLAFAPDGKTLASASTDRTIRIWDTTTAREVGQFRVADSAFHSIAFTKDGKTLISGGADTGVLVWDVSAAGNPPPKEKSNVITIK